MKMLKKGSSIMKKLLLCTIVLLLTGCASLVPTVEEVNQLETDIAALNTAIDNRQEEVKTQFAEVQDTVAKVNAAIQAGGSVLEVAQNVNKVSAPVNPYSGVIESVLSIVAALTIGGGAVAVKKNRDSNKVIASVNRLAAEANPEEGKKIIAALNGK